MALEQEKQVEQLALRKRELFRPFWIGYPKAKEILGILEDLLHHPQSHRMPNAAVIGETNNGKTMLLNRFYDRNTPEPDPTAEQTQIPILKLQTPPAPDESRLYNSMLEKLYAPGAQREPADSKLYRLKSLLFSLETRMIILDEFQHAVAGTGNRQRRFLNAVKYLGNELEVPIVVAGTPETRNALQADRQIANRFQPLDLPRWEPDERFLQLLATIEPKLGLRKPSKLIQPALADRVHQETDGIIGEVVTLLQRLAAQAMESGAERIVPDDLSKDSLKKIYWQRPGRRGRL
ncbi:TniB family NTP-binding protein [Natronospira bacteriovora]|uniref:TniB family NTP-binding protein n=1 Tax=Natronospira bacteriovora TaxID=3069753 RepID=A0ABU0W7C4_9GAMM|nr:TniB family NTP-binding protein [Natronospira sp. AB-CW4]MDQ2069818.1 TniB family NTP-binding protein [Natronospira sp. AB-CW4]